MPTRLRKLALTAHILFSVGWFGAVAAFVALAVTGLTSRDAQTLRTAYAGMELTARCAIVPLAAASLLSGIIQSLGTPWGLLRHYWVLAKLLLTTFAIVILLAKMPLIGYAARRAATTSSTGPDLHMAGMQLAIHAAGGMLVLLLITALSVYKPWGLTSYGQRKQQERRDESRISQQTSEVKTVPAPDNNAMSGSRSRRLRISLATAIAVFIAVAHVSLFLTGHSFHHGY